MADASDDPREKLIKAAEKLGIGRYTKHVFLCIGPECCSPETGQAAWEALKQAIKDAGLSSGTQACYRTKVGCLRLCMHGPIGVVYPEGTWYYGLTAERIPLLVKQHLVEGQPVAEWTFAENGLPLTQ